MVVSWFFAWQFFHYSRLFQGQISQAMVSMLGRDAFQTNILVSIAVSLIYSYSQNNTAYTIDDGKGGKLHVNGEL
jgi:hypothetical protein